MLELFQTLLMNQYHASLATLGQCIESCPGTVWNVPVARFPFCQVAFHTLFFTDYYLGTNPDGFRQQPFHLAHPDLFADYEQLEDREPVCLYGKPQIRLYLSFCRQKVVDALQTETEHSLMAASQFHRRTMSRAELHVYNIRHIQHHSAQLILRLRLDTDVDIPWIGTGWRDPGSMSS